MPPEAPGDTSLTVLLMRVSGLTLAIRQRDVVEILPVPRLAVVPEAPSVLAGAFQLAGDLVLVLRMATLLGLPAKAEGDPLYHHLLLLPAQAGRPKLALLVDRATDILEAAATILPPGESFNDCVDGEIRIEGALVPLLAASRLLTADEAARTEAFAARAVAREAAFSAPGVA
ncbi:chemotaxis protein CheW [Acidisoma sp.]|uniref:chemotaxis protein CheW n=1 Tax=Acidisoma sp. TaxID=1872115 RepID=UPI003B00C2EE